MRNNIGAIEEAVFTFLCSKVRKSKHLFGATTTPSPPIPFPQEISPNSLPPLTNAMQQAAKKSKGDLERALVERLRRWCLDIVSLFPPCHPTPPPPFPPPPLLGSQARKIESGPTTSKNSPFPILISREKDPVVCFLLLPLPWKTHCWSSVVGLRGAEGMEGGQQYLRS